MKIRLRPLRKLYRRNYAHLWNYVFPSNQAEECRLLEQFHPVYEALHLVDLHFLDGLTNSLPLPTASLPLSLYEYDRSDVSQSF